MQLHHAPEKCPRRLAPGEVRRCMNAGPVLVGYDIACPVCGKSFHYLAGDAKFVEGPFVKAVHHVPEDPDRVQAARDVNVTYPSTLTAERGMTCYGCRRVIHIKDNQIEATDR